MHRLLLSAAFLILALAGCQQDPGPATGSTARGSEEAALADSVGLADTADAASADAARADAGLVTVESAAGVQETFDRLLSAIESNENLTVMATVDHSANADGAGLRLPSTRLIVFGNPRLGTPLMQNARTTAIDLPQKLLVWEDGGRTYITYNDPRYLERRHGIMGQAETLDRIASALRGLATGGAP